MLRASLFDKILGLYLIRPKGSGVNTTLSAAVAAGATTLALTSTTGAADKDILIVGAGEEMEALVQNGAVSGSNATVFHGTKKAHAAGDAVVEGIAYDLGNVVNTAFADTAERRDLVNDVNRNPHGNSVGFLMYCLRTRLQSIDPTHLAFALGMPLARVLGAETVADPTQLFTDGDGLCRQPSWLVAAAMDEDSTVIYDERDAGDADYTGINIPLSQGADAGLDCKWIQRMHPRAIKGAINFVPDVSKMVTQAHFPAALVESGFISLKAGGLSTTLTTASVVDGNTMVLAAATAVAAGKWYLVEYGRQSQVVWVDSLLSLTATNRIRWAYVFPVGSTVKEVELISAGGLKEGATAFSIGGNIRPVKYDNSRVVCGVRAGTSRFGLGFSPTTFNLEMLRRRLGLPSSAISGGSTILTASDLVGTDHPLATYARLLRNDGKTVYMIVNQTSNTLEQLEFSLGQSDMNAIPLSHTGQSVQFLQHA